MDVDIDEPRHDPTGASIDHSGTTGHSLPGAYGFDASSAAEDNTGVEYAAGKYHASSEGDWLHHRDDIITPIATRS